MPDDAALRFPPHAGRQQESWRAFIELAPTLGDHCLLVGGQMVFLLEVERGSLDTRPTDDVDIVIDLRVEPAGLARVHQTPIDAGFDQVLPSTDGSQALVRSSVVNVEFTDGSIARVRRPTLVGALLGKVAAVTQIVSQTSAERAKHVGDVDSLARLLGPTDRQQADLTRKGSTARHSGELATMLAAAVASWQRAGICVFGVGPSATAARQLRDGAGTVADTFHKLVYEHSHKQTTGRCPADPLWDLPKRSVVIIDESGMVDTRLLHDYAQIARAKQWRTVLVGDHRQLDPVDAGGMFAELAHDPDVTTVELDTLHRFEHGWEADASLLLRDGDHAAIDAYDSHRRLHGHLDHEAAVEAVADAAYAGLVEGRDVLVMAPTNAVVDELNATLTERLLAAGRLDPTDRIDIAGCVFYPGQAVVTRANNRTLRYGDDEWVRNGDRWTVNAGTRDGLYLTNTDTGDRLALQAEYVAAGNVTVNYASTIHRAQGATVDEAHVIVNDRTNNRLLYVAATRGRGANHIHAAPPAFDPDEHGPARSHEDWLPRDAIAAALNTQPDAISAIARRRQLRELVNDTGELSPREQVNAESGRVPTGNRSDRTATAAEGFWRFRIKRNGQCLGRSTTSTGEDQTARLCSAPSPRRGDRLRRFRSGRLVGVRRESAAAVCTYRY